MGGAVDDRWPPRVADYLAVTWSAVAIRLAEVDLGTLALT
jgi:hypothetical protein